MNTKPSLKTPPLLLGSTLLFWGWQSDYLLVGALLGLLLESSRLLTVRWEFSDDDFNRIWTFCTLLFLASVVYAFTSNDGPSEFRGFFDNPNPATQRGAGTASARTAASLIKWLPMTFFLFVAAQAYSTRSGIPLETISLILRRRWKKARREGKPVPESRSVDLSYFYFALCLFAATIRQAEDQTFFWGISALVSWSLWPMRSRRFGLPLWIGTVAAVIVLGYFGQGGLNRLRNYIEGINPQWFTGFGRRGFDPTHSRTALGKIGRMKLSGQIIIRLEATEGLPPTYLREASYRTYRSQVWYSDFSKSSFESVPAETNGTSWPLVPGKTNTLNTSRIASFLPGNRGLLPLPSGSARLENLPAFVMQKNALGAIFAEGPGLVIFDAKFGPGPTVDAPPMPEDSREIPDKEVATLERVADELQLRGKTIAQAQKVLSRFFADNFTYSTWHEPSRMGTNETVLGRFLLKDRKGHCEYFATATVLLLRAAGFPARYAVGYAVHEGSNRKYVVRERDGHAWTLVWNETARAWEDFDTTPASWLPEERKRASNFQWLSDFWSRVKFEFARIRWGQTNWRQYILWGVTPILVLLLAQIILRSRRQRRKARELAALLPSWPGLDSEFYQLEKQLGRRGFVRQVAEPLAVWLKRAAAEPGMEDLRPVLQKLLNLHYRYRFDPLGLQPEERKDLQQHATQALSALRK